MTGTGARGPRFWRRARQWPLIGKLALALFVILLVAATFGALSKALHRDRGSGRGARTHPPVTSTAVSATTSPQSMTSTTLAASTTTATRRVTPTTRTSATSAPTKPRATRLVTLRIAPQSHQESYDREADFGGWIEQNGCQDTRAVLLIRTSQSPVTFTSASDCTVRTGRWTDPWSGIATTIAHDFQIDHTVPLDNAWISGAWSWTHAQRVAYANDLRDRDHLVAIDASENESKGADGPEEWRPPNRGTWCRYALDWDRIKAKWHLSATSSEWTALTAMAASC